MVDAPGHRYLMKNMISGAAVMDSAILVVDSTQDAGLVQTVEHLTAAEIVGIDNYIAIAQNKVDLLLDDRKCREKLQHNHSQIVEMVRNTNANTEWTPVLPTSFSPANQINVKLLLQQIVERGNASDNKLYSQYPLFIHCVRSFDINKPNPVTTIKGGVIGGSIMCGTLKIGDQIEIRPGVQGPDGKYIPLVTTVTSLFTGRTQLTEAHPGGLIGIGTTLDPLFTRSDAMVGMCAGYPGKLPTPTTTLYLDVKLLDNSIGHDYELQTKVAKMSRKDDYELSVGSATVHAKFIARTLLYTFSTETPLQFTIGDKVDIIGGGGDPVGNAVIIDVDSNNITIEDPAGKLPLKPNGNYNFDIYPNKPVTVWRRLRALKFNTSSPVCPVQNAVIPISKFNSSAMVIIGSGKLYNSQKRKQIVKDSIPDNYSNWLNAVVSLKTGRGNDQLRLPEPEIFKDGGAKLVWSNFATTCKKLNRESNDLQQFIAIETGSAVTIGATGQLIIHTRKKYKSTAIQNLLARYITKYVCCPSCKSIKTRQTANHKITQCICESCGSEFLR